MDHSEVLWSALRRVRLGITNVGRATWDASAVTSRALVAAISRSASSGDTTAAMSVE